MIALDPFPPAANRPRFRSTIALAILAGSVAAGFAQTTQPGPNLIEARMAHYSTARPDGSVVLIGGHGAGFSSLATVEHVNPAAGTTASYSLQSGHDSAAVVRLPDGTFFVGGGSAALGIPQYDLLEVYDPSTQTVLRSGHFKKFRASGGAAVLASGKILVAGGWWVHNDAHTFAEIVDPATLESTLTGPLTTARAWPYVVPLEGGGALVLGGISPTGGALPGSPERFDPVANTFTPVSLPLFQARPNLTLSSSTPIKDIGDLQLADGRYVFLGFDGNQPMLLTINSAGEAAVLTPPEALPDPTLTSTWNVVVDRTRGRVHVLSARYPSGNAQAILTVTTLGLDGTLLGSGSSEPLNLGYYVFYAGAVGLPDGSILLTGGNLSNNFDAVNQSLILHVNLGPSLAIQMVPAVWITGTPGATYTIQYSTQVNTNWTALADVLLNTSPQAYVDFSPEAKQRFYRAVAKP